VSEAQAPSMIIAFASLRARQRATALLRRGLGYAYDWWRGPKAGYAVVTPEEYARIRHLPGVTHARQRERQRNERCDDQPELRFGTGESRDCHRGCSSPT